MEAIQSIKLLDVGVPAVPEESGTDSTAGLFAKILADQAMTPGRGLKAAGRHPESRGVTAPPVGDGEIPPADFNEGTDAEAVILAGSTASLIPLPVTPTPTGGNLIPALGINTEPIFFKAVDGEAGLERMKNPGPLVAGQPETVPGSRLSFPSDPLTETIPEIGLKPGLSPEPAFRPGPPVSTTRPPIPRQDSQGPRPLEATNSVSFESNVKGPSPEIMMPGAETPNLLQAGGERASAGSAEIKGDTIVQQESGDLKIPSFSPVSGVGKSPTPTGFTFEAPLLVKGEREPGLAFEIMGAGRLTAGLPPAVNPDGAPEAEVLETLSPVRFPTAGGPQVEEIQGRENLQAIPKLPPLQAAAALNQNVPKPGGDPVRPIPEKGLSRTDPGAPQGPVQGQTVTDKNPHLENSLPPAEPANTPDHPESGQEARPNPAAGNPKPGTGRQFQEVQTAISMERPLPSSPVEAAPVEKPDLGQAAPRPSTGNQNQPVRAPGGEAGSFPADGRPGPELEKNFALGLTGASTANTPLPVEPVVAAASAPELQPPPREATITGTQVKELSSEPVEEKNPLFKQLSRGLVWSLHRGEEKIQIALDPPHLGTIFLELHRSRQTVEAQVWTDNPGTKGLLDSQQGQLQKALEQEGFRLDRFVVTVQQDLKSFSEERWAQGRQPAWERGPEQPKEAPESAPPRAGAADLLRFTHGNSYIDTWI